VEGNKSRKDCSISAGQRWKARTRSGEIGGYRNGKRKVAQGFRNLQSEIVINLEG